MATALRYGSNREWFVDPRGPERQMQVTCHGETQRVVMSMWHSNTCTATFQLPLGEAPRLIAQLADCLSGSVTETLATAPERPDASRVAALDRVRLALEQIVSRLRRRAH